MSEPPRPPLSSSSGDLLIDRRFGYAAALAESGDAAGAADLLGQILERVPAWLPAWMALAAAHEALGDRAAAEQAWIAATPFDPDGRHAAALHVARLRNPANPELPPAYVSALFDDYAPRFDRHLVDHLSYRGPAVILQAIQEAGGPPRFGCGLDLGCGTGLMGRAIRARVDHLVGVDLSAAMVAEAARTGLYDRLGVTPLTAALAATPADSLDLVLAADVFVYCGRLEGIFAGIARAMAPGGLLAFTVQKGEGDPMLGDDLRVAHSPDYLRAALAAAGLAIARLDDISTRTEKGHPVPGLVVVARKG